MNAIFQSNAYSLFLQSDIIQVVHKCKFISVINCANFFYQWRVHSKDQHKFIVTSHREQKTFKIAIMNYRNSFVYVQRQIDRIFKSFDFARAYVNDIVVFSNSLNDHVKHLQAIFQTFKTNNIWVNFKKTFLNYFSVRLLEQHVIFLKLFIDEFKLRTITNLKFSSVLDQLKTYIDLIEWFKQYIQKFAAIFKSLQNKKTELLRNAFKIENARKTYFSKVRFIESDKEIEAFDRIQESLFKSTYLIYFNCNRQLYVDLDSNKKMSINDVVYHVMNNNLANFLMYSIKKSIQSIMFFSRFLNSAEIRYRSTELKLTELIWVLRKIRHLMNFANKSSIIYIDHEIFFAIVKQTSLFTSSTDKVNLKLVRTSDYIQRFDFIIRHKSNKFHLVLNALFRLSIIAAFTKNHSLNEKLDVLFTVSLMKMTSKFKKKLIKEYFMNLIWIKIDKLITTFNRNDTNLFFVKIDELIYRKNNHNMSFILQRLCISKSLVKNILHIAHDVNHIDFDRTYLSVISFYYIKSLFTKINQYLKHCSKCVVNQIKWHKSYDSLQSIFSSSTLFHTITIDFVLVMSSFHINMNNVMTAICKFFKRATIIFDRDTWTAFQWTVTLLHKLDIANWELSKIIIFDRNRKFLFQLWNKLFQKLRINLFYFTTYHFQTNEVFERTN